MVTGQLMCAPRPRTQCETMPNVVKQPWPATDLNKFLNRVDVRRYSMDFFKNTSMASELSVESRGKSLEDLRGRF